MENRHLEKKVFFVSDCLGLEAKITCGDYGINDRRDVFVSDTPG